MKRSTMKTFAALALAGLLSACASTPSVDTQTAPNTNLAEYNTFGFVSPLGTDRAGYTSFLSSSLQGATRAALQAKGYTYTEDNPKMLVNFNVKVQQKTDIDTFGPPIAYGPWGYRAGLYGGWAGYGYPDMVDQYDEGTLMVDLVDPVQKAMVWEGVTKMRSNDASKWNEQQIRDHVNAVFAELPQAQ